MWAHLSGDVLLSARSGEPIAFVVGEVLYDDTNTPVYYFLDW